MLSSFARTPGAGEVASAACRPVCVVMGRRWMTSCSKSSGRAGREVERGRAEAAQVADLAEDAGDDARLHVPLLRDVAETRGNERARELALIADGETGERIGEDRVRLGIEPLIEARRPRQPRALAARADEDLVSPYVGDRAARGTVRVLQRDGHRAVRDAVEVVHRPVQRIDEPFLRFAS